MDQIGDYDEKTEHPENHNDNIFEKLPPYTASRVSWASSSSSHSVYTDGIIPKTMVTSFNIQNTPVKQVTYDIPATKLVHSIQHASYIFDQSTVQQQYHSQRQMEHIINLQSNEAIQTTYRSKVKNLNSRYGGFCSQYWTQLRDPAGWASCFYFLLISFPFGIFCFCWMLCSLTFAIGSMIFPPFGIFFCLGVGFSWRALARVELLLNEMCTHPQSFLICTCTSTYGAYHHHQNFPPIFTTNRLKNESQEKSSQSLISYGISICFDKFTWKSWLYFVFVKSLICTMTFILTIVLISLSFPMVLCCVPVMCIICRQMGKWQVRLTQKILLD
ncbi:hypothetical protein G9A89_002660 [Geosiphon pyriformis]|nr:hypothetical protein G9A89_002660 [Geosiphon pyriformis]